MFSLSEKAWVGGVSEISLTLVFRRSFPFRFVFVAVVIRLGYGGLCLQGLEDLLLIIVASGPGSLGQNTSGEEARSLSK